MVVMPKETEIEILYDDLKKVIAEKYEKMKGFKIAPMREIDIVDYLTMFYFHNIDNFTNLSDIITEWEIVPLRNDPEVIMILTKIKALSN